MATVLVGDHDDGLIAQRGRCPAVVSDKQQCCVVVVAHGPQGAHNIGGRNRVQRGRDFVSENKARAGP